MFYTEDLKYRIWVDTVPTDINYKYEIRLESLENNIWCLKMYIVVGTPPTDEYLLSKLRRYI